jgi:predicted metalloprotease with PDZ domain
MKHSPLTYRVIPRDPAGHLFAVTLTVPRPDPQGQVLTLPVWIPGSYLVREFAKNIVSMAARDARGPISLTKVDKSTWRAPRCEGALEVAIEVYAWDLSVRTAHLDETHGFFNGTSLFLAVQGQEHTPHRVVIEPPDHPRCAGWQLATTLPRLTGGEWDFGTFEAPDYDALVDHPVELGTFQVVSLTACGVPHHLVLTGRVELDAERMSADLQKICEHQIRFFGEPAPMDRYLFLTTVVHNGYGGLEHRSSTALICDRSAMPKPGMEAPTEGYRGFLGLCSHEYFHTWNVKRIKPAAFTPYDLTRENHTTLLWAFEGLTSYYDDLALVRSGTISEASYLELLGRTLTSVWRVPGRFKQSVADASFDAWTKFYRQDENAANALISYYTKGSVAGLALDLELRRRTHDRVSLDDLMRALWQRHGQTGVGVPEDGIEVLASELCGADLSDFFDELIRGTADPALGELLAHMGLRFHLRPAQSPDDKGGAPSGTAIEQLRRKGELGAKVVVQDSGAKLTEVILGGAAWRAGLAAGDVVVAVNGLRVVGRELIDRVAEAGPGKSLTLHAFRRDELMTFSLTPAAPSETTVWLEVDPDDAEGAARRKAWLGV